MYCSRTGSPVDGYNRIANKGEDRGDQGLTPVTIILSGAEGKRAKKKKSKKEKIKPLGLEAVGKESEEEDQQTWERDGNECREKAKSVRETHSPGERGGKWAR